MLAEVLTGTAYDLPGMDALYHGKVRDVYSLGDRLIMVASDRISAFDHVLPRAIPYKGQVLNSIASSMLHDARAICPVWLSDTPHPQVSAGMKCEPIPIEMVIRGYLAGHAWRTYRSGERSLCGVALPDGLRESDRLSQPIITPATKADAGHDEDISREEILAQKIIDPLSYGRMEEYTRALFAYGTLRAAKQGLLLVDTKYEFGLIDGEVYLMDEIHTPDSSRYYYADGYTERQRQGEPQRQLSKEFVREWLIEQGFMGRTGDVMPDMSDEFVQQISNRYIELYEILLGQPFVPHEGTDLYHDIERSILNYLA